MKNLKTVSRLTRLASYAKLQSHNRAIISAGLHVRAFGAIPIKTILILLLTTSLYLSGCSEDHDSTEMLKNDTQKQEIISAIANNDQLSSMMMDSLMHNHSEMMMTRIHSMMQGDQKMRMGMMHTMMSMAETDTAMCESMMQMMMHDPGMKMEMGKANTGACAAPEKVDHQMAHHSMPMK